jgi:hypothetical protein
MLVPGKPLHSSLMFVGKPQETTQEWIPLGSLGPHLQILD